MVIFHHFPIKHGDFPQFPHEKRWFSIVMWLFTSHLHLLMVSPRKATRLKSNGAQEPRNHVGEISQCITLFIRHNHMYIYISLYTYTYVNMYIYILHTYLYNYTSILYIYMLLWLITPNVSWWHPPKKLPWSTHLPSTQRVADRSLALRRWVKSSPPLMHSMISAYVTIVESLFRGGIYRYR